jgi:hypothetical protein
MLVHIRIFSKLLYYSTNTINYLLMKRCIDLPWTKQEDAEIILADNKGKLQSLRLPGRTTEQIKRRKRKSFQLFEAGELAKYMPAQEPARIAEKTFVEKLPTFDNSQKNKEMLQNKVQSLYAKLNTINPLDDEFSDTVNKLNAAEIKLESFYYSLKSSSRSMQK